MLTTCTGHNIKYSNDCTLSHFILYQPSQRHITNISVDSGICIIPLSYINQSNIVIKSCSVGNAGVDLLFLSVVFFTAGFLKIFP